MGFDAGAVSGHLDLDTTSFNKGFSEAHTHAETEGGRIREHLEALTEVFNEALGPAVAAFTSQISSMFAGFSEGPVIGGLNAVATAAGFVREAVMNVGADFQRLGLEATKAGVSVEFMDRFANVASTAGVGLDQVSAAFRILEERAESASEGDKKAQESFSKLGISASELTELMKSPQELFERVQHSIGGMTSAFDRQSAAHDVLGKSAAALIPVFEMSSAEFDKTAEQLDRLSGGVDANSVQMGQDMAKLQAYFSKAMEGIERSVAKPILNYLSAHMDEIEPKIEAVTNAIVSAIGGAWDFLMKASEAFQGVGAGDAALINEIGTAVESLTPLLKLLGEAVAELVKVEMAMLVVEAKVVVWACEEIGKAWKSLTTEGGFLNEVFTDLSKSPIAVAMWPILETFKLMYEAVHLLGEGISYLIDKLLALAGMDTPAPNIPATRGMTVDQAKAELKGAGVIVDGPDHSHASSPGESSGSASDSAPALPAAPEKRHSRSSGGTAATEAPDYDAGRSAPSGGARSSATSAPPSAPAKPEPTWDEMARQAIASTKTDLEKRAEAEAQKDSSSATGRQQTAGDVGSGSHRSSNHNTFGGINPAVFDGASESLKSLTIGSETLRKSFADLNDRLSGISLHGLGGSPQQGNGQNGGNVMYNQTFQISVTSATDPKQTADKVVAKLVPVLADIQRKHDQAAAGAVASKMVSSSMGG